MRAIPVGLDGMVSKLRRAGGGEQAAYVEFAVEPAGGEALEVAFGDVGDVDGHDENW